MNNIAPILFLLASVVFLFGAARLTTRWGWGEAIGSGIGLWLVTILVLVVMKQKPGWLALDIAEDRLLTYGRIVGLTGIVFLAGTSFDLSRIRSEARYVLRATISGLFVFGVVIFLFKYIAPLESGPLVLLAATAVAGSVWYLPQTRAGESVGHPAVASVALSTVAVAALYFFDILYGVPRSRASSTTYVVVGLYEALKLALIFAFGYFICTRFLERSQDRISSARTTIGFALIAILLFVLVLIATNQLAAIGWAFLAGALWRTTNDGAAFSDNPKPVAAAFLLAFTFISPLLQLHGRTLGSVMALPVILLSALLMKAFVVTLNSKGRSVKTSTVVTASLPGEVAVLLLGFGVTHWAIDSSVYLTILTYALLSALLIPVIIRLSQSRTPAVEGGPENKASAERTTHRLQKRSGGVRHVS